MCRSIWLIMPLDPPHLLICSPSDRLADAEIHLSGKVSNTLRFKYAVMPDPDDVERRIREMLLDAGYEKLAQEVAASLKAQEEQDQRISDTLDDLMLEADRLLLKMDEIDGCSLKTLNAEALEMEAQETDAWEGEYPCTR